MGSTEENFHRKKVFKISEHINIHIPKQNKQIIVFYARVFK